MTTAAVRETSRSPSYLALTCVGFLASATGAHAQATADEDKATTLKGVTVTATAIDDEDYRAEPDSPKFTAPLLDTPRSVVIVPKQVIKDTGSATLLEALRTVPGISLGAGEGGNPLGDRPFIRGFDSQASTYLDGVRDIGAQSREIFAVEQIEVVKGSNSALGGRGGAGGTLNLVSKVPQPDTAIDAAGSYGNADYKRITVDGNIRVSDMIGFRLNALYHDQDVAGRDALFQKRWGVAPSFTIGVDSPTKLTVMYYHLHTNELPDSGIPYKYTIGNAPAGVTETQPVRSLGGRKVDLDNFYGLKDRDFRKTDTDQATMRFETKLGDTIKLRNTTRVGHTSQSYIWTNPDDSAGNVASGLVARSPKSRFGNNDLFVNQTDLYGELHTGGIKHAFAAGLEFDWEKAYRNSYAITSTPRCPPGAGTALPGLPPYNCTDLFNPNPNDPWAGAVARNPDTSATISRITTKSAYLFDTITITDALLLNGGVRFDNYQLHVSLPLSGGSRPELRREDNIWSFQGGIVYKPVPNASLYASYATSNTPPGSFLGEGSDSNDVVPGRGQPAVSPDDLKVEKTRSMEIGGKWDVFDEKLSLTLAAFKTITDNARTVSENNTITFVGTRKIKGIEFGFSGKVTDAWSLFGGYTYLDSRITDGGFTITSGVAAPSVNTGKRFPNTPKHSFTLWTDYKVTKALKLGGGAIYNSKVYGGYADTRSVSNGQVVITNPFARSVPGYWRFDATASYDFTPNLGVQINVQNLTNKRYFTQAYSTHYAAIAPGRTVFATLNVHY